MIITNSKTPAQQQRRNSNNSSGNADALCIDANFINSASLVTMYSVR